MSHPDHRLDAHRLRRLLGGGTVGARVEVLESTASTNDALRNLASAGAPAGTVVVSNHQTSGRGQRGRSWYSAPGLGLYVSVLFRPSTPVIAPTRWTLVSALAGWEACRSAAGCELEIEWPNDLYHEGRKLAGTLTELRSLGGAVQEVVVGTGFNVYHATSDFPRWLGERATSLAMVRGDAHIDRELLASHYVERLAAGVALLDAGCWDQLRAAWCRCAPRSRGARVSVRRPDGEPSVIGLTRGIDDRGALRVERADGSVVDVHPGDSIITREM